MQLASRFAPRSPVLRADHPLSDDQIRTVAPSIFADTPHESRSERYSYIPTAAVLTELRKEGFQPFSSPKRISLGEATVLEDIKISTIFYGVIPFIITDIIRLIILVIVAACGCLALGWWQWSRWESASGTFQNLGYALQWPFFAGFCVYAYRKYVRYEQAPPEPRSATEATEIPEGLLPQRPAAATGGHHGEAHEIFVPPRKAQVHLAITANAEQLGAAVAAPFVFSGGRGRADVVALIGHAAGVVGSRHRGAPRFREHTQ